MPQLTKELADTLCTVIATGFIEQTGPKTHIIIEKDEDRADHERLKHLLEAYRVTLSYDKQEAKEKIPFILAKSQRTTREIMKGAVDELLHEYNSVESQINNYNSGENPPPLRGAYVGGLSTVSKVEFVGPSDLYLYRPEFRGRPGDEVERAYCAARGVSSIVNDFLYDKLPMKANDKIVWQRPTNSKKCLPEYRSGHLFGSVHGMTQSLIHYRPNSDPQALRVELALGRDTCKVASCVPCSIFMYSEEMPASATHLGRGDNWNFPEGDSPPEKWKSEVVNFYRKGLHTLGGNERVITLNRAGLSEDIIPALFLEALTFESSFIRKMLDTLGGARAA